MFLDDLGSTPLPRCPSDGSECTLVNDKFSSLMESVYSMSIVAASADTPEKQIPSYAHSRIFGALWFLFYTLVNFLLLNIVLGVVYQKYTERLKTDVLEFFRNRAVGLKAAYGVLTREGEGGEEPAEGVTRVQLVVSG